jgi:hypothetical protein
VGSLSPLGHQIQNIHNCKPPLVAESGC